MITRKNYIAIADLLARRIYLDGITNEIPPYVYGNLLKDLCAYLSNDNYKFNERKFRAYINKRVKEFSAELTINVKGRSV